MRKLCFLILLLSSPAFAAAPGFLARGLAVQTEATEKPLRARLYAADIWEYRSVLFLNPGGLIPALAMSGLAEAMAQKGHLVFVLDNPNNLPIEAPTLASDLAAVFRFHREPLVGLPDELNSANVRSLPLRAMGHSLGGAVLGNEIGKADSLFTEIILIGVSRLTFTPAQPAVRVTLLLGEKDGLAARAAVDQLAAVLGTETRILPGVNHFCIISDPSVGAPDKKALDLPTELSREQCVAAVAESLD